MSPVLTYSKPKLSLRRDGILEEDEISSHGPPEDPHENESTPLLAGPSCKPSYRTQVPASACNENTLIVEESSPKPNLLDLSPTSERVSRRRSSSLGSSYDIQRDSRSTSTTAHGASETCSEPCQPLPTSPHIRAPLFSLPQGISLRLENSGSVARDHLASERTFLAYMRTSLAIASSGVALVQFFSAASLPKGSTHRLHHYIRPLGASTVVVGLVVLFIGVVRYFTVQSALMKGYFPVARLATGFIAVVLTALVTLTFAILLAGKLEAKA